MSPAKNVKLFERILEDFHSQDILQSFILIGSWVLRVYAEHYDNNPQIPIVSTQDLDLLVENPPKIKKEVNVAKILEKYELEASFSPTGEQMKFVGPDFEVEFLYSQKGRGEGHGKVIKELAVIATPLRYMSFLQDNTRIMKYKGIPVRVPELPVFVLMKYLLVKKRKADQRLKIQKDISTAKDLELFLLEQGYEDEIRRYYQQMPKKWRKSLLGILRENNSELYGLLADVW